MRAATTTPVEPSGADLARLPVGGGLPRYYGGSASTLTLSRPAQCSLTLRPAWPTAPQKGTFPGVLQTIRRLLIRPRCFRLERELPGGICTHGTGAPWQGTHNVFVERLWRSLKYENVYLHAYASITEAKAGIGAWLNFYNEERLHQAHGYRTPRQIYEMQCPWTSGRSAAPNGSASSVSRARSGNGEMLTFAPMPTGINNKDLEIEKIAVTLRLAPTPMPGIDTAQ
jgi:hypothetical protein